MKNIVNRNDKGQLHGIQIIYHNNGQIRHRWNYHNGKEHGEHIGYYETGQICYKENYVNGKIVSKGEWIAYNRKLKMKMISNL
jgi:antitoxin component YwqK of YwqJK toxin-antitoxin module